jgi:hypothetical protein
MNPYLIVPIFKWDIEQYMTIEGGVIYKNCGVALTNFYRDTLVLKDPLVFSAEVDFYLSQLVTVLKDDVETIGHLYQDEPPIDVSVEILNSVVSPNLQTQAYDYLKNFDTSNITDHEARDGIEQLIYAIKAKGYN